eukprot:scaffold6493_cov81-Cylindrotheca_fusiformis.AAC.2
MVAFIPVVSVWIVGLLCAAQFLKPRLPKYSFQIRRLVPKWIDRTFKVRLNAGVWLRNDNYVPIDIHSLSCDVYYPDWSGALNHLGHVHDVQQDLQRQIKSKQQQQQQDQQVLLRKEETMFISQPLWKIEARRTFETNDQMFLQPVSIGLSVLSSLSYDLLWNYGTVDVPSSMVVQVKATNQKIPLTMNILCDNKLNTVTLELIGVTCELDHLMVGWNDDVLEQVVALRTKTIANHQKVQQQQQQQQIDNNNNNNNNNNKRNNGSIVGMKPKPPNFHEEFEKATKRIKWRDVPMLPF